jgi:GT2 family glycosyltransferase
MTDNNPGANATRTIRAVLLNWNSREQAYRCLERLRASAGVTVDTLVVDNGSAGDDADWFRERVDEDRVLALAENTGYAGGMNAGIRYWLEQGGSQPILIITPDAGVNDHTLRLLHDQLDSAPDIGIVGPAMFYARGLKPWVSAGGVVEPDHTRVRLLPVDTQTEPGDVDYVDGCCMLCRPLALADVVGFDPGYFIYYEEIDLCGRVRDAGWRVRVVPAAEVDHPKDVGRHPPYYFYYMTRNRFRFWKKNYDVGFTPVAGRLVVETARSWASALRAIVVPSRRPDWRGAMRDARLQTRALVHGTRDHLADRYGRMPDGRMPKA